MRLTSCFGLFLIAGSLAGVSTTQAVGQATYTITDLGTLPGGSYSYAGAINNSGQVSGLSDNSVGQFHAFVYSSGVMTDLGTLPGQSESFGYSINDAGWVTGESRINSQAPAGLGFLYSAGTMTSLGTLPGGVYSVGEGINNHSQVTGDSSPATGCCTHAFLYSGGTMSDIGTLPGGTSSNGSSINSFGQITGSSDGSGFTGAHAFLYNNGTMVDLGTFPGDSNPAYLGAAINDAGQVVVDSQPYIGLIGSHSYLYTGGRLVALGTLPGGTSSEGWGINSVGQVVGIANGAGFTTHAFLYTSAMIDLNTQIPANIGWTLLSAISINNAGQIVGQGTILGAIHAYVLTPPTISGLSVLTRSFNLPFGTANSLLAKLQAAEAAGPGSAACSDLNDFIAQVHAQSGKKLTVAQANQLIATATQVEVAEGCS